MNPKHPTAAVLALTLLAAAGMADAAEWKWTFTPYAWATDTGVDVRVAGRQVVDETIPVTDLLEDLDMILQFRLEAQKGALGAAIDLFDVAMSDETSGILLPDGSGQARVRSDVGMTILDVVGLYDPNGDRRGLALTAGTRIIDQRATIDATIESAADGTVQAAHEADDTFVDALVGVRYVTNLSRRFSLRMQADVSTGGTDHTWSAGPSLGYAFGDDGRHAVIAGYRHMEVDFEDDGAVAPAMTLSGALVGYRFSF